MHLSSLTPASLRAGHVITSGEEAWHAICTLRSFSFNYLSHPYSHPAHPSEPPVELEHWLGSRIGSAYTL